MSSLRIPYHPQPHALGHVYEDSELTIFFGDSRSGKQPLGLDFPDYRMMIMKQVHSDIVVRSPFGEPAPEADAQFTTEKKVALCVRTADCMPVLLYDKDSGIIAGIHAGWRGIENEIILKTAFTMKGAGATFRSARAWIGPHIMTESFEVGKDVAARLESRFEAVRGYSHEATSLRPHEDPAKSRVDLLTIARAQLGSIGVESDRLVELAIDTFTSEAHESFRRGKDKSSRQYSFIALK